MPDHASTVPPCDRQTIGLADVEALRSAVAQSFRANFLFFCGLATSIAPAVIAALLGCSSFEYTVVLHNTGSETIYDAEVSYGEFQSRGGVIVASASKGQGGVHEPIPDKAIVEWRLEDGAHFRREVTVKEVVPRDFSGEIWFEINLDEVRVVIKPPGRRERGERQPGP